MAEKGNFLKYQTKYKCSLKSTAYSVLLSLLIMISICSKNVYAFSLCNGQMCYQGECKVGNQNNTYCQCKDGWGGSSCSYCVGRVNLTEERGFLTDGWGNYSQDTKCMWLIDSGERKSPIRLRTNEFATECGWDHLYIFDGDSVFAPILSAYSGLVLSELNDKNNITEVVAKSGKAYVYFYSDAAYNMSGFNITYSIGGCPSSCSGHGTCQNSTCSCSSGWIGYNCEMESCPKNCSNHGVCSPEGICKCSAGFKGVDCSVPLGNEAWVKIPAKYPPPGRASSASVVIDDCLWIAGGYFFEKVDEINSFLVRYNFTTSEWNLETGKSPDENHPKDLYGHSMVAYNGSLYIYGGVSNRIVQNDLWIYRIAERKWEYKKPNQSIAVAGHTAVVVGHMMYIIFGHSPRYGYMNIIQEVNLNSPSIEWNVTTETNGALVKGGYGHTSVYSEQTGEIYVYGGYHSGSTTIYYLTDKLYSYHPLHRTWKVLQASDSPRYLHSAVIIGNLMLTFGGNTHNDTSISLGAKCYSPDFMVYDIMCNSWKYLTPVPGFDVEARYGHSAQVYTDVKNITRMYVFGGFNGIMLNDILEYSPGECSYYNNKSVCDAAFPGTVCKWTSDKCIDRDKGAVDPNCDPRADAKDVCPTLKDCPSCLSSRFGCKWCSNNCSNSCPANTQYIITEIPQCPHRYSSVCDKINNCFACIVNDDCHWDFSAKPPICSFLDQRSFESVSRSKQQGCGQPCYQYDSCENCTRYNCMWCGSQQRCVETNSYVASFLYGQCMEWRTKEEKCAATRCSDMHTCEECKMNPSCGWCNDVSNTGVGKCMSGSASGPLDLSFKHPVVNHTICPVERWHFVKCPACQCNGHSSCTIKPDECDSCQNLTEGDHCQTCQNGYYGNPKNGGNCTECSCNGQAETCDRLSGKCFCRTRGVIGDRCEKCDSPNSYHGDPLSGTCYYDLKTDYQFTFNLSKKDDDKYYTQINFMNIPSANDKDVDFTVNCSGQALLNISYRSKSQEETLKVNSHYCNYFRTKFEYKDFNFGPEDNLTFFVYVYNFTTPFWLQISFSQFPKIDLVHFFVTFFSCFLSLLIIAAVLYKIKHKYDSYRRRQRMMVEMEEMASRPFAVVTLELEKKIEAGNAEKKDINVDLRKRKRVSKPAQIALEPLHNQKAAVISLFVCLPTGDSDWSPSGQSGLAIASTLVTLGHQRKQSLEHVKTDKAKFKKYPFSPTADTCV
ncbi:hypothetical protein CHS0354_041323 [Potamilus streckersoni]|uniref:Attractin n=1 Tax=Potamilus streckersoni TaxID=2493646 RepID=A0AAE0VTP3_9BIVA|nr:hypothetical protein CHS0354_041323 [Potamilus streckersoni]